MVREGFVTRGEVRRVNPGLLSVSFPPLCACGRNLPSWDPVLVREARE